MAGAILSDLSNNFALRALHSIASSIVGVGAGIVISDKVLAKTLTISSMACKYIKSTSLKQLIGYVGTAGVVYCGNYAVSTLLGNHVISTLLGGSVFETAYAIGSIFYSSFLTAACVPSKESIDKDRHSTVIGLCSGSVGSLVGAVTYYFVPSALLSALVGSGVSGLACAGGMELNSLQQQHAKLKLQSKTMEIS